MSLTGPFPGEYSHKVGTRVFYVFPVGDGFCELEQVISVALLGELNIERLMLQVAEQDGDGKPGELMGLVNPGDAGSLFELFPVMTVYLAYVFHGFPRIRPL